LTIDIDGLFDFDKPPEHAFTRLDMYAEGATEGKANYKIRKLLKEGKIEQWGMWNRVMYFVKKGEK
jgi:hypothetical protein